MVNVKVASCHQEWHWPAASTTEPTVTGWLLSLRAPLRGGWCWSMSAGVTAGHLSTALPLPPITAIYPLWVSPLSEETGRPQRWMTAGLAGRTHPSAERIAPLPPRPKSVHLLLLNLLMHFILFPSRNAIYDELLDRLQKMLNYRCRGGHMAGGSMGCWEIRKERVREKVKERGHTSDMHRCSLHKGQFIKIIKPSIVLKVKLTYAHKADRETERGAAARHIHAK